MTQIFIVSGTSQTSPADWNNANNTVEGLGGGGSGGAVLGGSSSSSAAGGGGSEYRAIQNFSVATPGTTAFNYTIGLGGTAVTAGTTTNGHDGTQTTFNTSSLIAKPGLAGAASSGATASGGAGGTGGTGAFAHNDGGRGGNVTGGTRNATGGGGAGGSTGVGAQGVDTAGASAGTNGGKGDGIAGGAGGSGVTGVTGNPGTAGTEWDASHGSGGGGAGIGGSLTSAIGGAGGLYGSGGGGCRGLTTLATSGAGAQGIIVLTYTPVAANPQQQLDWPNPQIAGRSADRTIAVGLVNSTLASQDQFGGLAGRPQFDWPLPTGWQVNQRSFSVQLRNWTQSAFSGVDTFFGQAGNPNDDWQNPVLAKNRTGAAVSAESNVWQNYTALGILVTAYPVVLSFDWPNPRGYTFSNELRTWLADFPQELIGQDKFFGAAGNPNLDWPVPEGQRFVSKTFSVGLRTWTATLPIGLIGKDGFFGLAGAPNFDQPNPVAGQKNYTFPAQFRGYTESTNPALFPSGKPLLQTDWPNPTLAKDPRGRALRAWQEAWQNYVVIGLQVSLPFGLSEWPNPKGYIYPAGIRGSTYTWTLYLSAGQPAPASGRRGPLLTSTPGGFNIWYGNLPVNGKLK